ncbi:MAG: TrkA family potassium uptake protein [Planctomycetales bacterium]|nr:TrkA family potassium uptake protein [Planctomycetales bacterium]
MSSAGGNTEPRFSAARVAWRRLRRRVQHLLRRSWERPVVRASATVVLLAVLSGVALHVIERKDSAQFPDWPYNTLDGSFWQVGVLLFSGYDAEPPETTLGRALSFLCLFLGIALVLMLTADLSSQLVATALAGRGRKTVAVRGHVLLCGWHHTAESLVQQLVSRERHPRREIVVVDGHTQELSVFDPDVHLVAGDPTDHQTLERANAALAHTAIIPIDWKLSEDVQDSRTTLAALAVRSLNPEIYTCVEVLRPQNKRHIQRTGVDEAVCLGELSVRLLTAATVAHGLSRLVAEILTFNHGSEIYRVALPAELAGRSFRWLLAQLNQRSGAILLSVERQGEIFTNPLGEFLLQAGDRLFVLSPLCPENLAELADHG